MKEKIKNPYKETPEDTKIYVMFVSRFSRVITERLSCLPEKRILEGIWVSIDYCKVRLVSNVLQVLKLDWYDTYWKYMLPAAWSLHCSM